MEWQPIDTAPKGNYRNVKCGKGWDKAVYEPVYILVPTSDDKITMSYWVPTQERWSMFTKKTPPTHWMPLPEPPKRE